jgi:hypothetical protein
MDRSPSTSRIRAGCVFNEQVDHVARYLSLTAVSIRSQRFFIAGEWCRAARFHASALPLPERKRALLLCEVLALLGQEAESQKPTGRRPRKRGTCYICGARRAVIYEVRKFGFFADWACKECAADIEGETHG